MTKQVPELLSPRVAKAVAHPIRIEILSVLRKGPSSPARIERQLDNVSLNLISHHIKVLKELECVELVETVSRRGAREHVYRIVGPLIIGDREWDELTPKTRQRVLTELLRHLSIDLAESLGTGIFNEVTDTHISRLPLRLDEEGWSEVAEVLTRALTEVVEIGERSSERIETDEKASTPVTVAIMQFPIPR